MGQTAKNLLPETYYLDYFNFLLDFIEKNYANIIGIRENSFIEKFQSLSFDAKLLFVRLSNRKGPAFRVSKLVYREIPNIGPLLEELGRNQFISFDNKLNTEELLQLFTKIEITKVCKRHQWDQYYRSNNKKDDIIFSIIEHINEEIIKNSFFDEDVIIFFECTELNVFLKLLFFGDLYSDMTQFVIQLLQEVHRSTGKSINSYSITYFTYRTTLWAVDPETWKILRGRRILARIIGYI